MCSFLSTLNSNSGVCKYYILKVRINGKIKFEFRNVNPLDYLKFVSMGTEKYLQFQVKAHLRTELLVVSQGETVGMWIHLGMSGPICPSHLPIPTIYTGQPKVSFPPIPVITPSETLSCLLCP